MQSVIDFIVNLNVAEWVVAINGLLLGLIVFFQMIPGEAPEKQLKSVVDFIAKFSKK